MDVIIQVNAHLQSRKEPCIRGSCGFTFCKMIYAQTISMDMNSSHFGPFLEDQKHS